MGTDTMSNGTNGAGKSKPKQHASRPNIRPFRVASWSDIEPEDLHALVIAVESAGGAVMLGRTTDGGALSITVLVGDRKVKEYPKNAQDYHELVMWLKDDFLG